MEGLVMLPFSVGCVSKSSVAVDVPTTRPATNCTCTCTRQYGAAADINTSVREHSMLDSHPLPPTEMKIYSSLDHISSGIHRLVKTISFIFAYKEDGAEKEDMEIGFPTDVKHVTHIGPVTDGAYSSSSSVNNTNTNLARMMNITEMDLMVAPQNDVVQAITATSSSDHLVKPPAPSA